MALEDELLTILSRLDLPAVSREVLLERFAQTLELARYGEGGIGLENLCDNLYEFNASISQDACDRLSVLCQKYGVGPKRIALLTSLTNIGNPSADG